MKSAESRRTATDQPAEVVLRGNGSGSEQFLIKERRDEGARALSANGEGCRVRTRGYVFEGQAGGPVARHVEGRRKYRVS